MKYDPHLSTYDRAVVTAHLRRLTPVRCGGCGRLVGYSVANEHRIWCTDPFCHRQPAATPNETRDDAVFLLAKLGRHPREIADLLGVSRQRAIQIISARG